MRRWLLTILVALTPAIALAQSPVWPSGSPVALPSIPYVIPGPFIQGNGVANGAVLLKDGTPCSTMGVGFASSTTTGFTWDGSELAQCIAGTKSFAFRGTRILMYQGANQFLEWLSLAKITSTTDGVLQVANNAGTAGFNVDGTTDGTLALRNRSNTAGTGNLDVGAKITKYNNTTTAGLGVEVVVAAGRATAQTAANASVSTFTVGAADGTFEVSANVLVTTATTHTFTVECAYTDEGNTARTLTLPFTLVAGSAIVTSVANANGTVPYMGITMHIRAKAATAITIRTQAAGTYTTVTYNVEGLIRQIS